MQVDPLTYSGGNFNLYTYLSNSPAGNLDSTGLIDVLRTGSFKYGITIFSGTKFFENINVNSGILNIASGLQNNKNILAGEYDELVKESKDANGGKWVNPVFGSQSGAHILIAAWFNNDIGPFTYWHQMVETKSSGTNKDRVLVPDQPWHDDGGSREYAEQDYLKWLRVRYLTDSPGYGPKIEELSKFFKVSQDKKTYQILPIPGNLLKAIETAGRDIEFENKTKVVWSFITELIFKDPKNNNNETVLGTWKWGLEVSWNVKNAPPDVDIKNPQWSK